MEAQSSELTYPHRSPTKPIKLLLDGRKLGDGGIGVYTENLITGLLEVGGVDITVISKHRTPPTNGYSNRVTWLFDPATPYSLDEIVRMPRRIDFSRYDIFHAPHYVLPFRIPIPTVVTVHDIIHVTHPERFYYPWLARALIVSAARRADGVLAVSRHTRQGVLDLTKVSSDKVRFIPNAIAPRESQLHSASSSHSESPYLLAVLSNNKPHKGASDLLLAYQEFRNKKLWDGILPRCPKLVLAGYGTSDMLLSASTTSLVEEVDGLHIAGALSDDELRSTMARATALVVPSLVEGFCLPALEAQACGTPVICRPVPALQELVCEQDVVAKDFSVGALAVAMAEGLRGAVVSPRQANPKHLELFSCKHVASLVKAEYERVLSGRGA